MSGNHSNALSEIEIRVKALESLLIDKGYVEPATLEALVDTYENKIGPRNGAQVVAKSWVDPTFKTWLLDDATNAIASLGFTGRQGEHMVCVENTAQVHNLVVCTLCSCYPWSVLGPKLFLVRSLLQSLPFVTRPRLEQAFEHVVFGQHERAKLLYACEC